MKTQATVAGKMYTVTSPAGCTVTDETGLQLGTVEAGEQKTFVATGAQLSVDDDAARVTLTFNRAASVLRLLGGGVVEKWDKYALCKTPQDIQAVNADYITDLTNKGEWKWKLPNLVSIYMVFYFSQVSSFLADLPECINAANSFYQSKNLVRFKGSLPKLQSGSAMFYRCGRFTSFESTVPSLTEGPNMFYNCQIDKPSALRVLYSIPAYTSGTHKLTLGIHVDHQTDEEVIAAIEKAEAKGWTMEVQWNGKATAAAASTWGRRKPVFARLGEPMEDGTPALDWGHYVTDPSGYTEFASLEEAKEHFNIID